MREARLARMRKAVLLMVATVALAAAARADPFGKADSAAGKKAYEEARCGACHESVMGGDGNRIYTRPDHKIRSSAALLKRVRFCVEQTGAPVFPEDVRNIAAYLNQRFYKFTQ